MSSVANLTKGSASYCGPNAKPTTCPALWPSKLTNSTSECFKAAAITNSSLSNTTCNTEIPWVNRSNFNNISARIVDDEF